MPDGAPKKPSGRSCGEREEPIEANRSGLFTNRCVQRRIQPCSQPCSLWSGVRSASIASAWRGSVQVASDDGRCRERLCAGGTQQPAWGQLRRICHSSRQDPAIWKRAGNPCVQAMHASEGLSGTGRFKLRHSQGGMARPLGLGAPRAVEWPASHAARSRTRKAEPGLKTRPSPFHRVYGRHLWEGDVTVVD